LVRAGHLPIMACFKGEGKHIQFQILSHNSSLLNENVAAAKLTFRGLSGQLVSGTIRLIEDSNSTWKIADLQKI
jgi:hypothetical protein